MKTIPQCQPTPPEICEKESEENILGFNVSYISDQPRIESMLVSIISLRKQRIIKKQVNYNLNILQEYTSVVINCNYVGLMELFDNLRKHTKVQVDRYAVVRFCIS